MQDKMKKGKVSRTFGKALIFIVFFFFAGCGSKDAEENGVEEIVLANDDAAEEEAGQDEASENNGEEQTDTAAQTVFVYVCGAVESPGVYELRADARVFEAISSAGGITEEAAPDAVNQARVIVDGEQIYVPTVEEAASQTAGVGETTGTKGTENVKVNINTAGKEELMTLTGIGEAKADDILKYREEHGSFGSIEELMQISGIKEGVFNKIKDDITI